MSIKVSVIVPVYNAEPYISECIKSLLSQTIQDCEFIFVNDGSTDNSAAIIERYRRSDSRIILIQQPNQGVSVARNVGLIASSGEYVGFVDADDYIEADMYERLYNAAANGECDVVLSNFESEIEGHLVITKYPFPKEVRLTSEFIRKDVLPAFLKTEELNTACNKLYRNALVREHAVQFPKQVALGEDGIFNMFFFSYAATMKYIDYTGYHYREVSGSATRNIVQKDYFHRALEVFGAEPPVCYAGLMDQMAIRQLKSIKLIHSVLAYIHIYLKPTEEMSIGEQFSYVRRMIGNKEVRYALPIYLNEMELELGSYQKLMLLLMKRKSIVGLYCLTAYSRFRNKK